MKNKNKDKEEMKNLDELEALVMEGLHGWNIKGSPGNILLQSMIDEDNKGPKVSNGPDHRDFIEKDNNLEAFRFIEDLGHSEEDKKKLYDIIKYNIESNFMNKSDIKDYAKTVQFELNEQIELQNQANIEYQKDLECKKLSALIVNVAEGKKDISDLYKAIGYDKFQLDSLIDYSVYDYDESSILSAEQANTPRDVIIEAMDVFKKEHKVISSSKEQAKRAAELTGIAVGKVCLKIIAAVSLVIGQSIFTTGKMVKFGSLGIVNQIPGLSRDVIFQEIHSKGPFKLGGVSDGITSPGGRVNRLEAIGYKIARAGFEANRIANKEWSKSPIKKAKESAVNQLLNTREKFNNSRRM